MSGDFGYRCAGEFRYHVDVRTLFQLYPAYEYYLAAGQLSLAMLGMGAKLRPRDFLEVARSPYGVLLTVALQLAAAPGLAIFLAWSFGLPPGIALGMIVIAAMPSGTLSNVLAYLARGNIVLCIATTAVTTLGCLVTTPLVLRLFAASYLPEGFHMPAGRVVREIGLFLLLPLAVGMVVGRRRPQLAPRFSKWCLRGSLIVLGAIVVGSLGSGRLDLKAFGWSAPAAIVAFAILSWALAQGLAWLLRFSTADASTIGLAVLLRNANLAVLVTASLFPAVREANPIGSGVLFSALFYGGASLVISAAPVVWGRRAKFAQH